MLWTEIQLAQGKVQKFHFIYPRNAWGAGHITKAEGLRIYDILDIMYF